MSTRVVDQVDTWDEQSFSGGYRELHELADREFSGVVRAGGAELYMTRGVAVGLRMGEIEDLENAGTIYEAPAQALPLLAIMQERNDEVKAKYYTEKTSISKVDKTLSDGGFTGFIELSENVLSGDYYIVYQAGKSMSVAYVGESSRLLSGDEAFETADGEVGIYEVRPAEIEPVEIPEPESAPESATEEQTAATGVEDSAEGQAQADGTQQEPTAAKAESSSPTEEPPVTEDDRPAEPETETETTSESRSGEETKAVDSSTTDQSARSETDTGDSESAGGSAAETSAREQSPSDATDQTEERGQSASGASATTENEKRGRREHSTSTGSEQRNANRTEQSRHGDSPRQTQSSQEPPANSARNARNQSQRQREPPKESRSPPTSQSLETKSIPSLDPDRTEIPDQTDPTGTGIPQSRPERAETPEPAPQQRTQTPEPQHSSTQQQQSQPPDPRPKESATAESTDRSESRETERAVETERLETLETELEEKEAEIERLEDELETATSDREELTEQVQSLEAERDELEAKREELQSEVTRLETELERLEEELGAATDAERRITAGEALAGTDIFVRYRSKGKGTLEKAHGSSTRKDDVNENLRLEKHTQFDASTVAVGGQSYHEFLESTLEYQFVRWVVRELLFEIRDTGHEKELADLYDVLPQIDRAELSGVVDVVYTEDGQETQSQESFDVVLRNRMGHPLLAANLNDTREATTESMMERLITSAERVGQSSETFSGAFLVTESFFDPGALEVASSATQGGLLSRDKRKSFVNLSRKSGYHLCLVEARSENFHLAVPEL